MNILDRLAFKWIAKYQDDDRKTPPYNREMATGDPDLVQRWEKLYSINPDDLVAKKGLKIFDEMKKDDQVRAALAVKKFSRLSTPYSWKPASDDKADQEQADFMNGIIERMGKPFVSTLMAMLTAQDYGYSIMEKNYDYVKEGDWAGKIGLANIKSKKPHDFRFNVDLYGNVTELVQKQQGKDVLMPTDKFIVYSYQSLWENPYGESDLKAAYEAWWSKSIILKFWNMHLERWASPVIIGFYPPNIEPDVMDKLIDVLADIQIGTVGKVPEGIKIEVIDMKGSGGADLYAKAIEKRDRMICRAMLVPDLLGMGDVIKGGSYALGKKQFDLFFTMQNFWGKEIEEIIMEQLTKQMISINYGESDKYPIFEFEEFEEHSAEDKAKMNVQKAQTLQILSGAGFIDPLDEEVQQAAMEWMNILPGAGKGSQMAREALDFSVPLKFVNPNGRDYFELEIADNLHRFELLQDAFQKG